MAEQSLFVDMLRAGGSIVLNKNMLWAIGYPATAVYSELLSRQQYFSKHDGLTDDGFFFNTIEDLEAGTSLGRYQQEQAIKVLVGVGLIEQRNAGLPMRRFFKVSTDEEKVREILKKGLEKAENGAANKFAENSQTSMPKTSKLDCRKLASNNTNLIILTNKNENTLSSCSNDREAVSDIKEVASEIIDYLNEKAQTRYKATTAKTRSLINARLSEGFVVGDFKTVIDKKCAEWQGTEWEKFIRPETLFGTKFEGYLNARQTNKSANKNAELYEKALAKARELDARNQF